VSVPAGIRGGDTIAVSVLSGEVLVVVPDGLVEGDTFHVALTDAGDSRGLGAAPSELTVLVPEGCLPGDCFSVHACGATFDVEVPDGLLPGMEMAVLLPSGEEEEAAAAPAKANLANAPASEVDSGATELAPSVTRGASCLRGASSPTSFAPIHAHIHAYDAQDLRVPIPEPGYAFYVGQHIQLLRNSGRFSNGVVLDIIDAYETLYRCRIGEPGGTLEKNCGEDDIRSPQATPGFDLCIGQMVRVERHRDGRVVLATVLEPTYVDDEPNYRLKLEPADDLELAAAAGPSCVEVHAEDEILLKTSSAPGSSFTVGQLVQVRGVDGRFTQLARVYDLEISSGLHATHLNYLCRHVENGWGFPSTVASTGMDAKWEAH